MNDLSNERDRVYGSKKSVVIAAFSGIPCPPLPKILTQRPGDCVA